MVCDSIVLHVRLGSGPKLGFGGSGSARGDGEWCGGQRRGPGQRHGQRSPVVFKRAELPAQILHLSVLLCLQGHHLFDVSTKIKERKHQYGKRKRKTALQNSNSLTSLSACGVLPSNFHPPPRSHHRCCPAASVRDSWAGDWVL